MLDDRKDPFVVFLLAAATCEPNSSMRLKLEALIIFTTPGAMATAAVGDGGRDRSRTLGAADTPGVVSGFTLGGAGGGSAHTNSNE